MTTNPVEIADLDELDAYAVVNELNEHADFHDETVTRNADIEQSSHFTISSDGQAIIWRRGDGSVAKINSVLIDEQSDPRVSPGRPVTIQQEDDTDE